MFDLDTLVNAHKHCRRHRIEVSQSEVCGCFYCAEIIDPAEIRQWTDNNQTAICPRCGIDSLIGGKSGFPVADPAFLKAMHQHWF
ncbi:cytoplasmic protein [Bosea sp. (in: a-proteobacteria)]|jgi:uncharacterized paraquat-inducible protein A|uniref:cytoplasmic protein n=1 Tax=Bosea sp. (in: a-proteobacteria) TaxID=1871050 RepID=UPI003F703A59